MGFESGIDNPFNDLDAMTQQIVSELGVCGFTELELSPERVVLDLEARPSCRVEIFPIKGGAYSLTMFKGKDRLQVSNNLDSRDKVVNEILAYFF